MTTSSWTPCIYHGSTEATESFISEYFSDHQRRCLIVAGAGFDPRSIKICKSLRTILENRINGVFIREERPNPDQQLLALANSNEQALISFVDHGQILRIEVFAADGAVIGGRNIINQLTGIEFQEYTDIVVDLSAMSVGVSFPLVKYLRERVLSGAVKANLHLMVVGNPSVDLNIIPEPCDRVSHVRGFDGGAGTAETKKKARLWLPQLAFRKNSVLNQMRLHDLVSPNDICPILPFPSANPKTGDHLVEEFIFELLTSWDMDVTNLIFADESNPLDLYRTVLDIDDRRTKIFEELGGSLQILSPEGTRLLSIGALMAALDRNLPVVYVESISYTFANSGNAGTGTDQASLVHVWLEGEAYPPRQ